MRSSTDRFLRFFTLLLAAWQLALPGVASWADAQLEREERKVSVHAESESSGGCPRTHSADCVICRVLSTASLPPSERFAPIERAACIELPHDAPRINPARVALGVWQSRAPPVS